MELKIEFIVLLMKCKLDETINLVVFLVVQESRVLASLTCIQLSFVCIAAYVYLLRPRLSHLLGWIGALGVLRCIFVL